MPEEAELLDTTLEEYDYVCGASLFPAEHPQQEHIVGEICTDDVSSRYFSSNLALPNCCYCCGSTTDLVDELELRRKYQRVHQTCEDCRKKGRIARTRGPAHGGAPVAKRRKK